MELAPALLFGAPSPTLLGFDVIVVATVLVGRTLRFAAILGGLDWFAGVVPWLP